MNLYNYYDGVFTFVKLLFINLNITFNVNNSVNRFLFLDILILELIHMNSNLKIKY